MYTCERCGHRLEGNQERCAFCGPASNGIMLRAKRKSVRNVTVIFR